MPNAISAGHAAEETRKHARKILRTETTVNIIEIFEKKLNKSSHNTCNHNKRDFIKKCTFCDSSDLQGKYPADEKVCYVWNKNNYFKVCCQPVGKNVHETERNKSDVSPNQSDYEFFS